MYTGLTGTLNHSLHTQHILKPIFYFYRFSPGLFLSPLAYVPYSPSGVRESPQNSLNKWTRAPQPTHTAVFIFCSPSCLPMVHRKANTPLRRGKQNTASSHWKADTPTTLFRRKLGVQNRLGERRMRRVRTSGWKQGRTSTKKKNNQNKTKQKNTPNTFCSGTARTALRGNLTPFRKCWISGYMNGCQSGETRRRVRSVRLKSRTFTNQTKSEKTSTGLRRSYSSLLLARIIKSLCFVKE